MLSRPEPRSAPTRSPAPVVSLALSLVLGCAHAPPSPCETVGTMPGPEDFDRLPPGTEHALLVSSVERRGDAAKDPKGQLWRVDVEARAAEPLPIHGRDACSFVPHGLSTVERLSGAWEVFVIVHHPRADATREGCTIERGDDLPAKLDSIERYRWQDDGLRFIERLSDPLMTNLNDVHAAADGRLWVSNNPPWLEPSALVVDMLFDRRRGQVLLYRPIERRWSVAARRLLYPNGVMADPSAQHLLVTTARGRIRRFELDGVGESTVVSARGRARGTLDNLLRDDEGRAWTTGHPSSLAFIRHVEDPSEVSPTEVFMVQPHPRRKRRLTTQRVFRADDGSANAGSVALPMGHSIAVGQVFDPGVVVCDRAQTPLK